MNQIYFTADLHFGHANILKHSPRRPFADVINAGINKGRIPASAASLRSVNKRLDHFNLRTAEGYLINVAVALFGKNPTRKISHNYNLYITLRCEIVSVAATASTATNSRTPSRTIGPRLRLPHL